MEIYDEITAIIEDRGDAISRDDLRKIEYLLTQYRGEDSFERRGWVYESIMLTISDPLYKGDISLSDIEDDD